MRNQLKSPTPHIHPLFIDFFACFLCNQREAIAKSIKTDTEAAHTGLANNICHIYILTTISSSINKMGPSTSYIVDLWDPRLLSISSTVFLYSWHTGITTKIQRKYIPIPQALEIGEAGKMIQYSSKIIISSTSLLLNNANLSLHFHLQTLIFAYWLLNVTQPGCFGDRWLCAPLGTSSTQSLTTSNLTSP